VFGGKNEEMAKEVQMKVYLVGSTEDPERVIGVTIRRCRSSEPTPVLMEKISEQKSRELIKLVEEVGHVSTIEQGFFTIAFDDVSRVETHQLVRHRHFGFGHESQRAVKYDSVGLSYVMPPSIRRNKETRQRYQKDMATYEANYRWYIEQGISPEDARFVLPEATGTKIVMGGNARSWHEFLEKRLCRRAQWGIRAMAIGAGHLLREKSPDIFSNIGPTCLTQGICWEGEKGSCGLWKAVEGGEVRVRGKHQFKSGVRNDLSFIDE